MASMFGGGGGFGMGGRAGMTQRPRKQDTVKTALKCTLEELYNGCQKRLKITRKVRKAPLVALLLRACLLHIVLAF